MFPLLCGKYELHQRGNCICRISMIISNTFKPILGETYFPNPGRHQIYDPPLVAMSGKYHLINFGKLSTYNCFDSNQATPGIEEEDSCIGTCKRDASCKADFLRYYLQDHEGYCYLSSDVLSLRETPSSSSHASSYIKVLVHSPPPFSISLSPVLSATCAFVLALLIFVVVYMLLLQ